jgi:hypothetical protein
MNIEFLTQIGSSVENREIPFSRCAVNRIPQLSRYFLRLLPNFCPSLPRRLGNPRPASSRQNAILHADHFAQWNVPGHLQPNALHSAGAATWLVAFRVFFFARLIAARMSMNPPSGNVYQLGMGQTYRWRYRSASKHWQRSFVRRAFTVISSFLGRPPE